MERWAFAAEKLNNSAGKRTNGDAFMNTDQQVFNTSDRKYYLRPLRSEHTANDLGS
ncbi:MAG: hypothetical protein JNM31_11955 [Flavobacteriales bacterium]|nr:hypothetical protein [Flavobacteriales bacterium]